MSIMNEAQAKKMVRKQLVQHGAIGSPDEPFMSKFFAILGRKPGSQEALFVRGGVHAGEQERLFYVERDSSGTLITVDQYDCDKAQVKTATEPSLPSITTYELLFVIHDILRDMACNGKIVMPGGENVLFDALREKISLRYALKDKQIEMAFTALRELELRDHSRRLRLSGMTIKELPARTNTSSVQLIHHLDQLSGHANSLQQQLDERTEANTKMVDSLIDLRERMRLLEQENREVMNENIKLTEENERLVQSTNDLRARNQALSDFHRAVTAASKTYDKNTQ